MAFRRPQGCCVRLNPARRRPCAGVSMFPLFPKSVAFASRLLRPPLRPTTERFFGGTFATAVGRDVADANQRKNAPLRGGRQFSRVSTCVPRPRRLSRGGRNQKRRKPTPFLHLVTPASFDALLRARRSPQRKMRFTNEKRRRHPAETLSPEDGPPRRVTAARADAAVDRQQPLLHRASQ